ncbi:MAG: hypothetical protein C0401_07390 [Anaerolinea sp.]|nr:hypothetical protein [Anaerolinea sp.]
MNQVLLFNYLAKVKNTIMEKLEPIEKICWDHQPLAYIIRASFNPDSTTFLTPPEFKQQVGYVIYPKGGEVTRHVHLPIERHLIGTSEVLVIRKGLCEVDIYNDSQHLVATRTLQTGDVLLMVSGGHGFRVLEDTVFLEIKQGPYLDVEEKERF